VVKRFAIWKEVSLVVRTEDGVDTMLFVLKDYHYAPRDVFPEEFRFDYLAVLNPENVAKVEDSAGLHTVVRGVGSWTCVAIQ
jgi:hypothetical protein